MITHQLISSLKSRQRRMPPLTGFTVRHRDRATSWSCTLVKSCAFQKGLLEALLLFLIRVFATQIAAFSQGAPGQCTPGMNLFLTCCPLCVSAGFMTYIVEPLFERWAQFTGDTPLSENMLNHLRRNKAKWRSLLHKQHSSSRSNDHSGQVTGSQEQTYNEEETP